MKKILTFIQRRLSLKLGLSILVVVAVVFLISATFLFSMTRGYVKQASILNATQILEQIAARITGIMNKVETAADSAAWQMVGTLTPEAVISKTREILKANPNFYSCSVSLEPDYFKSYGRYFSIYSVRDGDSIHTAQYGNDQFSYFDMDWYRNPKQQNRGCWIDPFLNANPQAEYTVEIITSYSRPLYDQSGRFIGVVAIDLLQKWLSQTVTSVAPYPNSSSIIIGSKGNYFVHPDTAKLIRQTIFSDPDPRAKEDVVFLGKEMIAGKSGMRQLVVDGHDAYVFFRPIGHNGWSMAIVCPESDVFNGYNQLLRSVWIIIAAGLVVLLLFCYQTIRSAVIPLKLLDRQSRLIASGRLDDILPQTTRSDTIGQLQNSFVEMQQSLVKYVSDIRQMNEDMEQHNRELARANELVVEADRKKTEFVKDIMHKIRTPLNIISGFVQVLEGNFHNLPDDEARHIISMIQENDRKIGRIARLLVTSSDTGHQETLKKREFFSCSAFCREVANSFHPSSPTLVQFLLDICVPDTLPICTNKEGLKSILSELLDNADKFTRQGTITLSCYTIAADEGKVTVPTVCFAVTDTGSGIPIAERDHIFTQFTQLDTFTEGIGLGLSFCKKTAQLLGGDLLLDTSYEGGGRFVLTIAL